MPFHRRPTRLPAAYYIGTKAHFVTICCDLRRPYLANEAVAEMVLAHMMDCARQNSFVVHAYCVMPDHVHFLAQGVAPSADLLRFVRILKLRTAFGFRKAQGHRLWEKSYYDHILRNADSIEDVAMYIWWNPVRKQLCCSPWEFRFSGSQSIPRNTQALATPTWVPPWRRAKEPSVV
jgi:putative transposase